MTYEFIFTLINGVVMPAWALLIFLPKWSLTERFVHAAFYPLFFGVFYSYYLMFNIFFGGAADGVELTSMAGVMALFDTPTGVLVGWSHYLVFDLFVGAWISRDAVRRSVNLIAAAPCLLLTFLLGPVGLLAYVILRKATGKGGLSLVEV